MGGDGAQILLEIRQAVPSLLLFKGGDDVIQDIAVLVLEGRIDRTRLQEGIRFYLKSLKKKNSQSRDLSLEQPIGWDGGTLTIGDTIESGRSQNQGKKICPCGCKRRVGKKNKTYFSKRCWGKHAGELRKKINPKEIEYLRTKRKLSRAEIARILGVKDTSVAVSAYRNRILFPAVRSLYCKVLGCESLIHHSSSTGRRFCRQHSREKCSKYNHRAYRKKRPVPFTKADWSANGKKAMAIRWAGKREFTKDELSDILRRHNKGETGRELAASFGVSKTKLYRILRDGERVNVKFQTGG